MVSKLRTLPPVCFVISIAELLCRRLIYSKEFIGHAVQSDDGQVYKIFRHIKSHRLLENENGTVFLVKFKFARLSHKANKFISQFPMLLITGFPGFRAKMYAVNEQTGYWQGLYQWESMSALDRYKKSFVLKVMNKRAIEGSVKYFEIDNYRLEKYIIEQKI